MKKIFTIVYAVCTSAVLFGAVGHTTITFNDASRTGGFGSGGGTGRQIQTEIYYPAATAGDNVPVTGSNLPVIVFGHGFSMGYDAYDNIWTDLVARGYVVCFPRTEGGIFPAPSHPDFSKDLAIVASKIQLLNTTASTTMPAVSLFLNKLSSKTGLMGHSMGGGSSYLETTYNGAVFSTIATFAAAETNPTSSGAAPTIAVNIPQLLISGVNDCVAPPATHQDLIYTALASTQKTQIYITGGGHCFFANSNAACSFGEGTCTPTPTITRTQQQDVAQDHIAIWMDFHLKNICSKAQEFQDSLASSNRTTFRQSAPLICTVSGVGLSEVSNNQFTVAPNPSNGDFQIYGDAQINSWNLISVTGQSVLKGDSVKVQSSNLPEGMYILQIELKDGSKETIRVILKK